MTLTFGRDPYAWALLLIVDRRSGMVVLSFLCWEAVLSWTPPTREDRAAAGLAELKAVGADLDAMLGTTPSAN